MKRPPRNAHLFGNLWTVTICPNLTGNDPPFGHAHLSFEMPTPDEDDDHIIRGRE